MRIIAQKKHSTRLRVVKKKSDIIVRDEIINAGLAFELDFKGVDYVGM